MAKRQSTSNVYRRRNGRSERARVRPSRAQASSTTSVSRDDLSPSLGLAAILRTERDRLSEAQSVLACVHLALVYADPDGHESPDCAKALAIALSLVRETAQRLDAARVTRNGEDPSSTSSRRKALSATR